MRMPPRSSKLPPTFRVRTPIPDVMRFRSNADWTVPVPREHLAKIDALFRYYDLAPEQRPWEKLCWLLLRDFVPGFLFKKRPKGRPPKWSPGAEASLVDDVDRLKKEGFTIRAACELLARKQPYRAFGS